MSEKSETQNAETTKTNKKENKTMKKVFWVLFMAVLVCSVLFASEKIIENEVVSNTKKKVEGMVDKVISENYLEDFARILKQEVDKKVNTEEFTNSVNEKVAENMPVEIEKIKAEYEAKFKVWKKDYEKEQSVKLEAEKKRLEDEFNSRVDNELQSRIDEEFNSRVAVEVDKKIRSIISGFSTQTN